MYMICYKALTQRVLHQPRRSDATSISSGGAKNDVILKTHGGWLDFMEKIMSRWCPWI